jgi:hypothetical protein
MRENGSFSSSNFHETKIFHSAIAVFHTLPQWTFRNQFSYIHFATGILLARNHCLAPTYQTACSAQDTAHEQYRTCDSVVQSEHHVVYHRLVYEEPYFDESGN